jgi:hypothetical protein
MRPRKFDRIAYYASGVVAEILPAAIARGRKDALLKGLAQGPLPAALIDRVNYYNKLAPGRVLARSTSVRGMPRDKSYYFYDLMPLAKAFGPDLRIACLFGDITFVPDQSSIVKSRPIGDGNANSVIMKLDRLRHFTVTPDTVPFERKLPNAVWRGGFGHLPHRTALVKRWAKDTRHDIGYAGRSIDGAPGKNFLSPQMQMRHRYIVSVEGADVATNLKWILASNCLCLMPRPRFETWFMEGTLRPGIHYVELRPDFEDLDEKVDHYERNRDEALAIIANANAHWRGFEDDREEELVSLLVLQKYFEATGQIGPSAFSEAFFGHAAFYPDKVDISIS